MHGARRWFSLPPGSVTGSLRFCEGANARKRGHCDILVAFSKLGVRLWCAGRALEPCETSAGGECRDDDKCHVQAGFNISCAVPVGRTSCREGSHCNLVGAG